MVLAARARYARGVARRIYRFGSYSVDPAARELRRAGALVVLSPKVFDCIAWLIEHRDRAVGRDELVAAVWGKVDVADTQLVQAMLKARRAVGDSGEEQRLIRTIPRFGYRWVGEVDEATSEAPAEVQPLGPEPEAVETPALVRPGTGAQGARVPLVALLVVAGLLAIGGIAAWRLWPRSAGTSVREAHTEAAPIAPAAVVLPATVSAGDEWSWLRLGLMDLVAHRLREAGLMTVPSDNVVALLREVRADDAAVRAVVRKALAPRWMILPTVRRDAAGWTVHLELRDENDERRMVEASAADSTAAARVAADRLLVALGRSGPAGVGEAAGDLIPRIRAALLGSDFETARRLIGAASPAQRETPEIRLFQAQVDFGIGRFDAAYAGFTALLGEVREEVDPLLRVRALNGRGVSAIRLADAALGERDFDAALAVLHDRNEPALIGQAYTGRGVTRAMQGRDDGAMADFARARIALQVAGDTLALARLETNEGALNGQRGHAADALAGFRSAAAHFERFGAFNELAGALANQIAAHLALLEPDRAVQVGERAQALAHRLENPSARLLLDYWRASALAAAGRLNEAQQRLEALARSTDAARDADVLAMSWNLQAALALAAAEPERATMLSRRALAGVAGAHGVAVQGEAWLTLIRALRSQGRDADAAVEVQRFVVWAQGNARPPVAIRARLAEAEHAWGERRREAAAEAYADALRMAERETVPADIAEVSVSWGNALIAEGELEAAAAVVGRVARWAADDFACALLQARLYRALGQASAWRSALAQVRALAGERPIPPGIAVEPGGAAVVSRP